MVEFVEIVRSDFKFEDIMLSNSLNEQIILMFVLFSFIILEVVIQDVILAVDHMLEDVKN